MDLFLVIFKILNTGTWIGWKQFGMWEYDV